MFAVRTFAISLAAFAVLLSPTAASATEPQIAHGTFDLAVVAVTSVHPADGNLLITQTLRGSFAGDASGPVDEVEQLVVHPTGEAEFQGTDVCSCTVAGRSGTLIDRFEGRVAADGQLTGTVRSISSSGGLSGLHFEGNIAGPTTGPNAGTYTIRLHFDPTGRSPALGLQAGQRSRLVISTPNGIQPHNCVQGVSHTGGLAVLGDGCRDCLASKEWSRAGGSRAMNAVARKAVQAGTQANVWMYRRTSGRVGGRGMGRLPLLLLTVAGRNSGTPRTVPIAYFDHNGDYIVVGTGMGGSKRTPQWFLNLKAAGKGLAVPRPNAT